MTITYSEVWILAGTIAQIIGFFIFLVSSRRTEASTRQHEATEVPIGKMMFTNGEGVGIILVIIGLATTIFGIFD
jgi:hypothetical protein